MPFPSMVYFGQIIDQFLLITYIVSRLCVLFNFSNAKQFFIWLPSVVARRSPQPQVIQLVVRMEIRRSRKILLSFFEPLPSVRIRKPHIYKNTIAEALKIKEFINNGSGHITWAKACKKLHVSESKLAHLLKIVNKLPSEFVEDMRSCNDEEKLKIFNGRRLLQISHLKTTEERRKEIKRLSVETNSVRTLAIFH